MDSAVDKGRGSTEAVVSRSAVEGLAGALTDGQWSRLQDYASLLLASARPLSLISRGAERELGLHLVDSAAFIHATMGTAGAADVPELADLGTGGGLPGAVVAILRPRVRVTLIDSRNSRIVFLKQVTRRLGLENVEILHTRLEALEGRRAFSLVASRALGSLEETLAGSLRLLTPAGRLVLFKGPRWVDEEPRAVAVAESCGCEMGPVTRVELPGYGRTTTFVEFHVKQAAMPQS